MKDKEDFDVELKAAFDNSFDWKGSREDMWRNIERRLSEKRNLHRFRNTRAAAGLAVAAILCVVFLVIPINHNISGDKLKNTPNTQVTPKGEKFASNQTQLPSSSRSISNQEASVKEYLGPINLRWNFDLNLKDESCTPGQEIKLNMTFTGGQEDTKIIEKAPSIVITRIGKVDHDEKIDVMPLLQLENKIIKKDESINLELKFKAPTESGFYFVQLGELKIQNSMGISQTSGGGAKFIVTASKSEVYVKNIPINKELNAHGNIIKVKDIVMNEKETKINYTISFAERHADCRFKLVTDTGETLYQIDWIGRDIQNGMDAMVGFNPVRNNVKKLYLEVIDLNETTADGVKGIKGDWNLEMPIN
ncbi:hypothetical protein [Candidatus Clostridium radicumherbarum]|uniref:DUF4179 domain-containing protein n=1 Tax=Candidatus Clostridium radicumherbarum TaxID=3381662 RepID=A0ABW8TRA1_9CLOT